MNTHIEALVDRIFGHLQQLGSRVPSRRRAGLSPAGIKEAIHDQSLNAPDELIALYACCDGTSTQEGEILGEIQFFPGFYWMNLDDALETYRGVSKSAEWGGSWLPILANGGGDFYAVVCDSASPYFGEVVGFVLGEPDQIVEFKGITSLLETIERSFADGAFFISEGLLKADYPRMRAIAREVQPGFMEHEV
jgi:hypothetical protein